MAVWLLALVTLSRGAERLWARANTARLMARGGVEVAAGHYPAIVALHGAWLLALWIWGVGQAVAWGWLALFLLAQTGRVWVLASLGRRWTTRIIVLPGEAVVTGGPYRWVRNPNYLIVAVELAALPLALNLPWLALAASLANAAVMALRIPAEDRALRSSRARPSPTGPSASPQTPRGTHRP